jgi:hypothetical protein
MSYSNFVKTLLEELKAKKRYIVKYDGEEYTTYAYSKQSALANIGVRIARENNIKREYYNRYIQKVIDNGRANLIEEKCWKGYRQMGMKKKGKRLVPNCVKNKGKKTK